MACAVVLSAGLIRATAAGAEPSNGTLTTNSYSNSAGTLSYELYVPASYDASKPTPLIVALHGCTQSADIFRKQTRFDDLAAQKGFIVVYPEQSKGNNQFTCWNWFQSAHQNRDAGEPSMIAGITRTIQGQYNVDPARTYVAGLSAGAAMSEVMGVTYPDLYAAVGIGSGCEYQAGAACAGYKSQDPEVAGKAAHQAMGSHARLLPGIVFQGDKDTTVPPVNADQLVQAGQVMNDLADDGAQNGSVPSAPAKTTNGMSSGGEAYTVNYYSDGHGHELSQYWVVHGMAHAWSGGDAAEQYSDPKGPDESTAMYEFFMSHPMGGTGPSLGDPAMPGGGSLPSVPGLPGNGGGSGTGTTLPTGGGTLPTGGGTLPKITWPVNLPRPTKVTWPTWKWPTVTSPAHH
jgi:poly(hydroxyalkanoate) depolymerase family esterase